MNEDYSVAFVRVKTVEGERYNYLVRSVRGPRGPRQKFIAYLGKSNTPTDRKAVLQAELADTEAKIARLKMRHSCLNDLKQMRRLQAESSRLERRIQVLCRVERQFIIRAKPLTMRQIHQLTRKAAREAGMSVKAYEESLVRKLRKSK